MHATHALISHTNCNTDVDTPKIKWCQLLRTNIYFTRNSLIWPIVPTLLTPAVPRRSNTCSCQPHEPLNTQHAPELISSSITIMSLSSPHTITSYKTRPILYFTHMHCIYQHSITMQMVLMANRAHLVCLFETHRQTLQQSQWADGSTVVSQVSHKYQPSKTTLHITNRATFPLCRPYLWWM